MNPRKVRYVMKQRNWLTPCSQKARESERDCTVLFRDNCTFRTIAGIDTVSRSRCSDIIEKASGFSRLAEVLGYGLPVQYLPNSQSAYRETCQNPKFSNTILPSIPRILDEEKVQKARSQLLERSCSDCFISCWVSNNAFVEA